MRKATAIFILILLMTSCSDDAVRFSDTDQSEPTLVTIKSDTIINPALGVTPLGELYISIYESYTAQGYGYGSSTNVAANVESVAISDPSFSVLLNSQPYIPVSPDIVAAIKSQAINSSLYAALQATSLSEAGKQKLLQLYENLEILKMENMEYDAVNSYMLEYDASVSNNPGLTPNDSEILLITSTILNNGFYAESKKRRRDRDWDLSIGHIATTTYGADLGPADAITYSLSGKYSLL
ncbi:hypothetical protein [Flavobacterium beibuense]|uniref:Lipoprotein n=1 Tax=Flavobacterium beibuense TaxID=657326 RepID=A0A444WEQ7_9FLAO|nr:hypothetical protein [Flavobacterium beibuense]RYJ44299.1 hypothetical protein NU09_0909 [Flavobacterium beibuense]